MPGYQNGPSPTCASHHRLPEWFLDSLLSRQHHDSISAEVKFASLGQTWLHLLALVADAGTPMAEEGSECLGIEVSFNVASQPDPILERFADQEMIREMEKVFFGDGATSLGHSYAGLMRGPAGRNDLEDVIDLLRAEPWTKRAVLTFCPTPNGKMPCISVVQFLIRGGQLRTVYFARGQDVFRKFYADGHCIGAMARKVAGSLRCDPGSVVGFLSSAHIYNQDLPKIRRVLALAADYLGPLRHAESSPLVTEGSQ